MNIEFREAEALFFEDPQVDHAPPRTYSVLYLLRRDIDYCMGEGRGKPRALFPAAMAILAGIDLLAKFHTGSDTASVGKRFRAFIDCYFEPIDADEAEQVYQLRNALMHSFGLYSKIVGRQTRQPKQEYWFRVHAGESGTGRLVEPRGNDRYFVGIRTLWKRFEFAVGRYRSELNARPELQDNFLEMWDYYGYVGADSEMPSEGP